MSPKTFDIADLPNNLTDLLSDIQNHVEVTLTRQGVPWAKVLPLANPEKQLEAIPPRVGGLGKGAFGLLMISMMSQRRLTLCFTGRSNGFFI
jgi:antitoxin (DNA-binding transcriptional repressor) of toxin-antitoxin stability system